MSLGMESRALRGRKRERERTELRVRDSLSRRDKGNFGCVMDEQGGGGGSRTISTSNSDIEAAALDKTVV